MGGNLGDLVGVAHPRLSVMCDPSPARVRSVFIRLLRRPYDLYKRLRDEAPVYYNEQYRFWALFRVGRRAHGQPRVAKPSPAVTASTCRPCEHCQKPSFDSIIMMDPPNTIGCGRS